MIDADQPLLLVPMYGMDQVCHRAHLHVQHGVHRIHDSGSVRCHRHLDVRHARRFLMRQGIQYHVQHRHEKAQRTLVDEVIARHKV